LSWSKSSAAIAAIVAGCGLVHAGEIVIGDFSTPFSATSVIPGSLGTAAGYTFPTSPFQGAPAGAVSDRTTTMTLNAGTTSNFLVRDSAGLTFKNENTQTNNSFQIIYDNSTSDFSAITAPGGFVFDVLSSNLDGRQTPAFVAVTITMNEESRTGDVSGEGTSSVAFADFDTVDFANATVIGFVFGTGPTNNADIDLGSFEPAAVIPLPTASGMAALGLLAVGVRRRRA
jgi:hypothetical protein